jgi:hypothetical protein
LLRLHFLGIADHAKACPHEKGGRDAYGDKLLVRRHAWMWTILLLRRQSARGELPAGARDWLRE